MKRGILALQMAEEMKPYRGPDSRYKSSPYDLLLNVYTNIDRDRLMADIREISKEFVRTSLDVSRLSSEKAALHLEKEFLKIVNQGLEKERDLWKKETNDLFWASSRALVENTQISGEMFRKANQIIEYYRSYLATLVMCLYLFFPFRAVDRLIDFAWELETTSRKRRAIQNEVQLSTSYLSMATRPQGPSKIKTQVEEIDLIYSEDEDDKKRQERLFPNKMVRIIREKKMATVAELCTQLKLAPTTVYRYAGWLQDACPSIKFDNGKFHTI
jgi:hypothetical protein